MQNKILYTVMDLVLFVGSFEQFSLPLHGSQFNEKKELE